MEFIFQNRANGSSSCCSSGLQHKLCCFKEKTKYHEKEKNSSNISIDWIPTDKNLEKQPGWAV